jgi:hypothetical protein
MNARPIAVLIAALSVACSFYDSTNSIPAESDAEPTASGGASGAAGASGSGAGGHGGSNGASGGSGDGATGGSATGGSAAGGTSPSGAATGGTSPSGAATGGAAGAGGREAGGSGGDTIDASRDASAGGATDGRAADAGTCAGFALQFDGTSSNAHLTRVVQDDFTIEAWIQTSTMSFTGTSFWDGNGLIYADVQGIADDFGMSLLNNKVSFGIGNPDTTIIGATDVTTGKWVHVAASRNATTGEIQIIVNGVLDKTTIATNKRPLSAPMLISLGGNTIDGHYFLGMMDEVRIWKVVRTASDIGATMHQRLTGTEANLVGYYRFDDPGGMTTADASPSMNPAVLAGGVLPVFVPSDAPICP